MKRACENCTKCCEGHLRGNVDGIAFFRGKPCHFVKLENGCSRYATRPKDPCQTYSCSWLTNPEIPEWMKPDKVNAIIDIKKVDDMEYISVVEAGETLRSDVLTFIISYALNNGKNLLWEVNGGRHWLGSKKFVDEAKKEWA